MSHAASNQGFDLISLFFFFYKEQFLGVMDMISTFSKKQLTLGKIGKYLEADFSKVRKRSTNDHAKA